MSRTEVRIAGFGGQGVVLAGVLLGTAAAVTDGRRALQIQSFGPAARGGGVRSEVIISDAPIVYPRVTHPDILIVLSETAMQKYEANLVPGGLLVVDADLVTNITRDDVRVASIPASHLAMQEFGQTIVANLVMLGVLVAKTSVVSRAGMEAAIRTTMPPRAIELNLRAFHRGLEIGETVQVREPTGHATA